MKLPEPIYISGPMSGYPGLNREAFVTATAELQRQGFEVISPHEVDEEPGKAWADYIRKDLVLLAAARSVVTLAGWECSRGARLEVHIAIALGMTVVPFAVMLRSHREENMLVAASFPSMTEYEKRIIDGHFAT